MSKLTRYDHETGTEVPLEKTPEQFAAEISEAIAAMIVAAITYPDTFRARHEDLTNILTEALAK